MSVTTSVNVLVNYLKVKKVNAVSFFLLIVFGKNVLTVTVEGEMRVFQDSFYEKSLNLIIKEL